MFQWTISVLYRNTVRSECFLDWISSQLCTPLVYFFLGVITRRNSADTWSPSCSRTSHMLRYVSCNMSYYDESDIMPDSSKYFLALLFSKRSSRMWSATDPRRWALHATTGLHSRTETCLVVVKLVFTAKVHLSFFCIAIWIFYTLKTASLASKECEKHLKSVFWM